GDRSEGGASMVRATIGAGCRGENVWTPPSAGKTPSPHPATTAPIPSATICVMIRLFISSPFPASDRAFAPGLFLKPVNSGQFLNRGAMTLHRVSVSLGSNIGDRVANLHAAIESLRDLEHTHLLAASALYETQPRVVEEQPDFINACVVLETRLRPHELLSALLRIEQTMGRVRVLDKGPRTIDLDILLFDQEQINDPDLQIPHPGLCERAFVLVP